MTFLKNAVKDFIFAVFAGISISIGCVAFLTAGAASKVVGSLFFTVGLFMILNFDFNLFTGKVCFALDNKPDYLIRLIIIWLGNFAGACLMALTVSATRIGSLSEYCSQIVATKLGDSVLSVFLLGILCNILIFTAVYGYKKFDNPIAKTLALFFGVSVFVLCGFVHCVADMFYFAFAGAWSGKMIGYLLMITLGNAVGGLLIPATMKLVGLLTQSKPRHTQTACSDNGGDAEENK